MIIEYKDNEFIPNLEYSYFIKDLELDEIYTKYHTNNVNYISALLSIYLNEILQDKNIIVHKIEYPTGSSNSNYITLVTYSVNGLYKERDFMIIVSTNIDTMN